MDTKTVLAVLVRMVLVTVGGALAQHGVIGATGVDQFVSISSAVLLIVGSTGWSIWSKWGQPILEAQMEIWKLKAISRRDALVQADIKVPPSPTAAQVNAATPSSVTPAIAAAAVQAAPSVAMEHAI